VNQQEGYSNEDRISLLELIGNFFGIGDFLGNAGRQIADRDRVIREQSGYLTPPPGHPEDPSLWRRF